MTDPSTGANVGRRRWRAWMLVAASAALVAVLVASFLAFVKTGLALKKPAETPISLAGCDVATFVDYAGDAGSGIQTLAPFGLMCKVGAMSPSAPTCDDVVSEYVAAHGALRKDVFVAVFRGTQSVCSQRYSGDGSRR